jgi:hypothetical protein
MQGVRSDFLSYGLPAISADEGPCRKGKGMQTRRVLVISDWRGPRDFYHCFSAQPLVNCDTSM